MERISIENAREFIACEDDYTREGFENAKYFTLTPSKDGWDDVTYYTARKSTLYSNRGGEYDSWVYVLSNAIQPGIYKVGYTNKHPEERAKQISNVTGVALPYDVEFAFHCYNGEMLEGEVHKKLNGYRVNNQREFFQLPLDEIKISIEKLGERYL